MCAGAAGKESEVVKMLKSCVVEAHEPKAASKSILPKLDLKLIF